MAATATQSGRQFDAFLAPAIRAINANMKKHPAIIWITGGFELAFLSSGQPPHGVNARGLGWCEVRDYVTALPGYYLSMVN